MFSYSSFSAYMLHSCFLHPNANLRFFFSFSTLWWYSVHFLNIIFHLLSSSLFSYLLIYITRSVFFFFFGFFNSAICPFVIRNNLNLVFFLKGKMYQFPEKEPSLIYFLYTDSTFRSFSHFTSKSRIIPYKQLKIFSSKPKKGIIFLFFCDEETVNLFFHSIKI